MNNIDKGTLIRTIVLVIALLNQVLVTAGLNPVPGNEGVWGEVIATVITAAASIWAWFKNNYITTKGKKQKQVLKREGLTNAK